MRAVLFEALAVAAVAGLVFQSLRQWVGDHYVVPSNSMQPTLHGDGARGDHVFVDKLASASALRRYDLAIFRTPEADLVKRVVAFGDDPQRCWIELRDGDLWLGADATHLEREVKHPLDHRDLRVPWLRWPEGALDDWLAVPAGDTVALHAVGGLDAARRCCHEDVRRALFADSRRDADFGEWISTVRAVDATYLDVRGRRGTEGASLVVADIGIDFEFVPTGRGVLCGIDFGPESWMFHWDSGSGATELWRNGETVAAHALPRAAAAEAGPVRIEYGYLDGQFFFAVDARADLLWTVPRKAEWVAADPGPSASPLPANRLCLALVDGAPARLLRLQVFHDVHWFRPPLEVGADPARVRPAKLVPPGCVYLLGDNTPDSRDSRMFGPVPLHDFVGRPRAVLGPWPRLRCLPR